MISFGRLGHIFRYRCGLRIISEVSNQFVDIVTLLHNTWFLPLNPCAVTLSWCSPYNVEEMCVPAMGLSISNRWTSRPLFYMDWLTNSSTLRYPKVLKTKPTKERFASCSKHYTVSNNLYVFGMRVSLSLSLTNWDLSALIPITASFSFPKASTDHCKLVRWRHQDFVIQKKRSDWSRQGRANLCIWDGWNGRNQLLPENQGQ